MPSIVHTGLKQACVYWPRLIPDGFPNGGICEAPTEVPCRWTDGSEKRIDEDTSVVLVGQDMAVGGFIRLGGLDELLPVNAESYPPTGPPEFDAIAGYWDFEGTLAAQDGPDFGIVSGTTEFDLGAFGALALFNDDDDFEIETATVVPWGGESRVTVSMFVNLAPAVPTDDVYAALDIGPASLVVRADKVTYNGSEWAQAVGWADDFVHVMLVLEDGERPVLFVGGFEASRTVDGAAFVGPIVAAEFNVTTSLLGASATWSRFGVDELRAYSAALDARDAQLLAAIHPSLYRDAEEILDFKAANSVNQRFRVRKVWLKDKR